MNKKRFISMFSAAIVSVSLFSGCGQKQELKPITEGTSKSSQVKVGLSTDEGGLNDKSFNQAADTGIKEAQKKFGVDYKPIESTKKEDYEANLEALVSNGSNLVFGVGFQMEQAMKDVAGKHKDKNFAIIDTTVDLSNVESITFKEQEGSFLMGVIAGKMTKTNKVGFIGGKDQALINKFEAGFAAGVKAVNPQAATGLISADGKSPGTMVKYADSFNDTNKGYELAKSLYGEGCDVIYHAAGGVGIGMFKAGIGVDMDQAVTVPEYAGVILSSMVKRVDTATYNAVQDAVNGKFQGGKHVELGLKEDGVGIAGTSNKNTPKEVLDLVNKFAEAIKAGKFTVPATRDEANKFTVPSI